MYLLKSNEAFSWHCAVIPVARDLSFGCHSLIGTHGTYFSICHPRSKLLDGHWTSNSISLKIFLQTIKLSIGEPNLNSRKSTTRAVASSTWELSRRTFVESAYCKAHYEQVPLVCKSLNRACWLHRIDGLILPFSLYFFFARANPPTHNERLRWALNCPGWWECFETWTAASGTSAAVRPVA